MAVHPHAFPRSYRLSGTLQFASVYDTKMRTTRGPLLVCSRPNALNHLRLGLSVSRRVGNAIRRNRVKRLIREAFRLQSEALPPGYDLVVVVRPHEPLELADYQNMLKDLVKRADSQWTRKRPAAGDSPVGG